MPLDAEVFADLAQKFYQEEMESAFPEVIKTRKVESVANEDGTTTFSIEDKTGPIEINPKDMRPQFVAVGRAIVEFLTHYAGVSAGRIS